MLTFGKSALVLLWNPKRFPKFVDSNMNFLDPNRISFWSENAVFAYFLKRRCVFSGCRADVSFFSKFHCRGSFFIDAKLRPIGHGSKKPPIAFACQAQVCREIRFFFFVARDKGVYFYFFHGDSNLEVIIILIGVIFRFLNLWNE